MITEQMIRDEIIIEAKKYLGQRETNGNNRSPWLDALERIFGMIAQAWCAMYATYCVRNVCKRLGLKNPVGLKAGSQDCFYDAPPKYRFRTKGKKGCFGVLRNKADHSHGHVYIVEADQTDPKLHATIEGNTNKAGSRDGDGVYENMRSTDGTATKDFLGFVDVAAWICDANGIPRSHA